MGNEGQKKFHIGLLPRLIIAIVLGVVVGTMARSAELPLIIQIGATFNSIFGNFLGFCIPLIIIGFVVSGIAELGDGTEKTLGLTVLIAYASTLFAGLLAYFVDVSVFHAFSPANTREWHRTSCAWVRP